MFDEIPISTIKLHEGRFQTFHDISTNSSKSNQLRNVNTVRLESGNVTAQPWEINNRKSEVIEFVVNAGINVTANNFYF